jgi:uncharacterized protein (DUF697 family)
MEKPKLAEEMKQLNANIATLNKNYSLTRSFARGMVSGLGSVIGATIVVALLAFILNSVQVVPVIGDWVAQIAEYVESGK